MKKKIAAVSMCRNDSFFLERWISYYGKILGYKNLYLFIDGIDQKLPLRAEQINCFQISHIKLNRLKADRYRAKRISDFAKKLHKKYDVVLATDIDEFLVIDPNTGLKLKEYLSKNFISSSLSALGIDVAQHPTFEKSIDKNKPFLSQRKYAFVSDRYTKPIISLEPLNWGSGFHRVKGKDFTIDPNLFLFHFGLVDIKILKNKHKDRELISLGWNNHFKRRYKLYEKIKNQIPVEADQLFEKSREYFKKNRKLIAWNKPTSLKMPDLIKIPKRFKDLV